MGRGPSKPRPSARKASWQEWERYENDLDAWQKARSANWGPRTVGSIDGEDVTFRQGVGDKDGHTLIADGQPSGRDFNGRDGGKGHNHYSPDGDDHFATDRGKYSGPGR